MNHNKNIDVNNDEDKSEYIFPPTFAQIFPSSCRFMGILRRRVVRRVVHVGGEDVVLSPDESIGKSSQARQVLHVHLLFLSCYFISFVFLSLLLLDLFLLFFCLLFYLFLYVYYISSFGN